MKIASIIIGFFSLFLLTCAALFKIQHYPGGAIMLIVGLGTFATFFIPVYFISKIQDEKTGVGKAGNGFAIFALTLFFLGLLFKIQHYPGAGPMLILGALLLICPTSILLLIAAFKNDSSMANYLKTILFAAFTVVWVLILGFADFSSDAVSHIQLIDEELITSTSILESNLENQAMELEKANILNETEMLPFSSLIDKRKEICYFIDEQMKQMISKSGGRDQYSDRGNWGVYGARNSDIPAIQMLGKGNANKLKTLLLEYEIISDKCLRISVKHGGVKKIKKASNLLLRNISKRNWESGLFDHSPLFITLPVLTAIKSRLTSTESMLLSSISR